MNRRSFLAGLFSLPVLTLPVIVSPPSPDESPDDPRVGFKGKTSMDPGFYYAPYIPLQIRKI